MYTSAESTQASAAAAAAAASSQKNQSTGDAALFTKELLDKLATKPASAEKASATMGRLASALPGLTVSNHSALSSFAGAGTYFLETGADSTANISPELLSAMADDEQLFNKVKDMVGSLMTAGKSQTLMASSGADSTSRNVAVSGEGARYVEVQRDANGRATSISSLLFDTQQKVNNALDMLINRNKGGGNFLGGTSSAQQSNGFSGITGFSSSWRMESMFTADSAAMQTLATRQAQITQIEVVIEQLEGQSMSGSDFFTFMQMNGLIDPLVLDLGGEGINLSSAEDGVYFDMLGDGTPVKTSWISGNNAFLYLDDNGNGVADDINELFGDQGGFANGFDKLAQYDDNGDGVIDENDAIYSQLRLWRDLNGDGVNQADESLSLAEAGVKSINLNYDNNRQFDAHGNMIGERSFFTKSDGSKGAMADVWLKHL